MTSFFNRSRTFVSAKFLHWRSQKGSSKQRQNNFLADSSSLSTPLEAEEAEEALFLISPGAHNPFQRKAVQTKLDMHVAFYLPHLIFFLYKIGQSVFSPTTKLYLYSSVCSDRYGSGGPIHFTETSSHLIHTTATSPSNFGKWEFPVQVNETHKKYLQVPKTVTLKPSNLSIPNCQNLTGAQEDDIQMEAADYIMAMKILQDVPAFILGLFCGGWSDRVGRRLPMMLPCFGGIVVSFMFMCIQWSGGIALPGILFGIALNSMSGRNTLVSMAIQAYITDQTSEQERTRQLGRILAMNFFGLFAGSFIMAFLADRVSFWVVFLCVAVFYSLSLSLIYFALPESRIQCHHAGGIHAQQNKRISASSSSSSVANHRVEKCHQSAESWDEMPLLQKLMSCAKMDNFTDTLNTITRYRPNNMRKYLIAAYICILLHNMCKSGEIDVLLLFVKHTPLNWTKSGYGYLLSFQYANVGLFLIIVLPFLLNKLGLSDSSIIVGCVLAKAFGLSILAFSNQSWMVFVANVFVSTFGMIISCLRSIVSKLVDEDETGRCFAIISSSETVSDLIGVVFFTRLYYIGLSYPNGRPLPFMVMACIHIILLFLAIYISFGLKKLSGEGATILGGYDTLQDEVEDSNNFDDSDYQPVRTQQTAFPSTQPASTLTASVAGNSGDAVGFPEHARPTFENPNQNYGAVHSQNPFYESRVNSSNY